MVRGNEAVDVKGYITNIIHMTQEQYFMVRKILHFHHNSIRVRNKMFFKRKFRGTLVLTSIKRFNTFDNTLIITSPVSSISMTVIGIINRSPMIGVNSLTQWINPRSRSPWTKDSFYNNKPSKDQFFLVLPTIPSTTNPTQKSPYFRANPRKCRTPLDPSGWGSTEFLDG